MACLILRRSGSAQPATMLMDCPVIICLLSDDCLQSTPVKASKMKSENTIWLKTRSKRRPPDS